jgi:capsular polysaccharide biosynthesis protein
LEQELDLQQLWQVLVKRWKLLIFMPLATALISALISLFIITPQYSASSTLMVMRPTDTAQIMYQDIQVSRQLVETYREIARSRRVLLVAIANNALPFGVDQLREKVDVVALRNTEIITVTATDADPQMAAKIANGVTAAFMEEIIELVKVDYVNLVDPAVEPASPISPRVPMNVAVALVVGMMAAVGLAFLIEYLDRSIKDPDEISRLLDLPVLGVIPQMEEQ